MRFVVVGMAALVAVGCGNDDTDDKGRDTGPPPAAGEVDVYINEFVASNADGLESPGFPDESGAFPDWIELYNAGDDAVDLSGYWLTDDTSDILKWQFPDGVSIPAGGYLIVFADGDTDQGDLHASFSLDRISEDIALHGLSSDNNPVIDSIEDYDPQATNQSLARVPDGSTVWELDPTPTPGAANDGQ